MSGKDPMPGPYVALKSSLDIIVGLYKVFGQVIYD